MNVQPKDHSVNDINAGKQLTNNSSVTADIFNIILESLAFMRER